MKYLKLARKKIKYWKTIVFFFNIFIIQNIYLLIIENLKKLKVCLCTVGKEENLYVREYVSHYKKYNLDKIFIYDNNEINGEMFSDSINDYISSGFVEIINIRGKIAPQLKSFQHCFEKNKNKFNWILFYDMDEYIYFHTDNNQLYYENKTLAERFPEKKITKNGVLKSILRTDVKTQIYCPHEINRSLISCDGFGMLNTKYKFIINTKKPDFKYNYIDHYSYKSVEEFAKKVVKSDAIEGLRIKRKYEKIDWYFMINKLTKDKIDLLENITKLNLSNLRMRLKHYKIL